jgi:hypothetical protein
MKVKMKLLSLLLVSLSCLLELPLLRLLLRLHSMMPEFAQILTALNSIQGDMSSIQQEVCSINLRVEQCQLVIQECLKHHHPSLDDED